MSLDLIRKAAENDLLAFIKIMAPHRILGSIHEEVINWWTRGDGGDHQLLLMPRDHQKSALIAYRVAWEITKNPATTVLYISATATLAEKQLYFIKNILTSKQYRRYWPDMVHEDEGKREKWTEREICVDHPKRKAEGVRDSTIFTAGLTTTITGLHFNIAVLDDVVIKENAYTAEGRTKVKEQYSLLASIETTGAQEWIVGTRYHPKDLYTDLIQMEKDVYNKDGELVEKLPVYEVLQKQVEDLGDGTGEFLWPRQQRSDGKWFGFDANILASKRAKYLDRTQFRAQYYNDPNDPSDDFIDRSRFQYYNKTSILNHYGDWYYKDNKLNVYASIDFAFSKSRRADYTSIVVIGIDKSNSIYILDIDRFKTDKISEYFKHIRELHIKWGFKKLRAETSVAQKVIVRELKEYIQKDGLYLSVDENSPTRHSGSKEERIAALLEPRYENMGIWHYRGGNCEILEEELVLAHPPHDDVKDALAAVVEIAIPPMNRGGAVKQETKLSYHPRFGGAY
jgi:phage terminase large subunit-like protein